MANLRAGLIGLGMMGRHHARVLSSLEGVEFVATVDPGGDKFGASAGQPLLNSITDLIKAGIDYAIVAVPTAYHEEVALELADNGIHALIEKPLAQDPQAAERIAKAYESRGLVGGVGHIERYNAALQQARIRIECGDLGEIIQVATRRQGPYPGRIADVGVIKDLGTHDIDLTAWVTQQEYRTVAALTAFKSGRKHEDLVSILGSMSGGTITSHIINWLSPLKERTTVITGTKGTYVADTLTADLTFYANGSVRTTWDDISRFRGVTEGDVVRYAYPKPEPLLMEHENFRDAILGKGLDIVTMRQALSTVKVAEAALSSAQSGKVVNVQSLDQEGD